MIVLSTIWLCYGQLCAIIKGGKPLTRCWSLRFYIFDPNLYRVPRNEIGSLNPVEHLVGFEPGTFWFWLQCLDQLGYSSNLTYNLLPFMLITFWILNFLICFLQFFFVERSNNFSAIKISNNLSPRHRMFDFFNHKEFFRPVWKVTFCKKIFVFWYFSMVKKSKFRAFFIFFSIKVNIHILFVIRFHSNCSMICIVVYHLIYQYTHFLILKSYIYKFYSVRF